MEHLFAANSIMSNDKCSVFLTEIGMPVVSSLIAPEKPGETDFATLSKAMTNHYAPVPSEIVQRFRFSSRFCQRLWLSHVHSQIV